MIDLINEPLISLEQARKHPLLKMSNGRDPSFCTLLRYAQAGVRGGVKLETVVKPSGLFTSDVAIVRFIEALTLAKFPAVSRSTPASRRNSIKRAQATLDDAGM